MGCQIIIMLLVQLVGIITCCFFCNLASSECNYIQKTCLLIMKGSGHELSGIFANYMK
jgi:hypothetical protein